MKRDLQAASIDAMLEARTLAEQSEREILGTLLLHGDRAFDSLPQSLRDEHFAFEQHRTVFGAIRSLAAAGRAFTVVDVYEHLARAGCPDARELIGHMNDWTAGAAGSTRALPARAERLVEAARMRQLRAIAHSVDEIIARSASSSDALAELGRLIDEAAGTRLTAGVQSLSALLTQVAKYHDEMSRLSDEDLARSRVSTGLGGLDDMMPLGLEEGDLIVLGARPSIGKTALATAIGMNVALAGHCVLQFSMEMSSTQQAHRILASQLGRMLREVRELRWRDEALFTQTVALADAMEHVPFFIDDSPPCSVDQLVLKVRAFARRHPLKLLIIDYVQMMSGSSTADENRTEQMREIGRALKSLGKELKLRVIALSQLNRKVEDRPNKRPTMSDLRESGSLEQDADVVMLMYRDDYYDPDSMARGIVEVDFKKQRNDQVGVAYLHFDRATQRFGDTDWRPAAAAPASKGW